MSDNLAPSAESLPFKWTERKIAAFLARHTFAKKSVVIVPNCSWPGSECDVLAVTQNLRVIDVEIKISRADLKADAKKDKWFEMTPWLPGQLHSDRKRIPVNWPKRVWKHYYCVPYAIWRDDLYAAINPASGVLFIKESHGSMFITCQRMAKPRRDADRLTPEDAIDVARLANLRMWDAYDQLAAMQAAK